MEKIGDYSGIGNWIKAERKRQKIMQKDLAKKTGYSSRHLIYVEGGTGLPSVVMADNILNALGYKLVFGIERIEDGTN